MVNSSLSKPARKGLERVITRSETTCICFPNTLNVLCFPIWINEYLKMSKGSVKSTSSPDFGIWKFVYFAWGQKEYFPSRIPLCSSIFPRKSWDSQKKFIIVEQLSQCSHLPAADFLGRRRICAGALFADMPIHSSLAEQNSLLEKMQQKSEPSPINPLLCFGASIGGLAGIFERKTPSLWLLGKLTEEGCLFPYVFVSFLPQTETTPLFLLPFSCFGVSSNLCSHGFASWKQEQESAPWGCPAAARSMEID